LFVQVYVVIMRWKAALLELLYDDRPCRVAHEGLTKRTERDDFVVKHFSFSELAPKAGLEPATTRLTAARSTN
jgi:hypothetical protein